MTCDEVRDLLPAYVLDALSEAELTAIDEHLSECSEHIEELAELRDGTRALEGAITERAPRAALRTAILERASAPPTDGGVDGSTRPAPITLRPATPPRPWWRSPAVAAAAVVLVLASVVGASMLVSGGDGDSGVIVRQVEAGATPGLRVEYDGGQAEAVISPLQFPSAPAGRTYQVWVIRAGAAPASLGLIADPAEPTVIEVSLEAGDVVAITEEPDGGSAQPTTDPIVAVEI
ncbi:MAG: anti-sigma factor [Dehalococcoidia bacterium]